MSISVGNTTRTDIFDMEKYDNIILTSILYYFIGGIMKEEIKKLVDEIPTDDLFLISLLNILRGFLKNKEKKEA